MARRPDPHHFGRRRWATTRAGFVLGAVVATTLLGLNLLDLPGSHHRWGPAATWVTDVSDRPTPRAAPQPGPIGTPLPPPARSGPHEFMATQHDTDQPVAYDPCRPIPIVVNELRAPSGSTQLLRNSLDRMGEITGFSFEVEGTSSEVPELPRPAYQPERYGDRWAPVLVMWADEHDVPELAGVAGLGGSSIAQAPGSSTAVFVSGVVVLHGPSFDQLLSSSRGWLAAEGVILHELGHLLGLDHVDDPNELMYHGVSMRDDFGVGDLTGLATLSSGPCVPEI